MIPLELQRIDLDLLSMYLTVLIGRSVMWKWYLWSYADWGGDRVAVGL